MNIITLVKQAPDTTQLSGSLDGLKLLAEGAPRVLNPLDEYALETALQLVEAHGGSVTALMVGPAAATETLRTALAMGANQAVLVDDPALAAADTLATARTLAAAIGKLAPFDLIIGGRAGIEGNTGATAIQTAALLNLPLVSYVAALKTVDPAARTLTAVRLLDNERQIVETPLPALLTVVKEINEPRFPTFMQLRKAKKATIPTWNLADIGLTAAEVAPQVSWQAELPPAGQARLELIEGSPAQAAAQLVERLSKQQII